MWLDSACLTLTELTLQAGIHIACVQIVRVVVAGGLLKSTEGLLQATTHKQPPQQAAALAPIRSPAPNLLKLEKNSASKLSNQASLIVFAVIADLPMPLTCIWTDTPCQVTVLCRQCKHIRAFVLMKLTGWPAAVMATPFNVASGAYKFGI